MRRKQATALIDEIRTLVASWKAGYGSATGAMVRLETELESAGLKPLEPCEGEAHLTGEGRANGHIDHCSLCAPRWGFIGPVEVVS